LTAFLENGSIEIGGGVDEEMMLIEPTVLTEITWDMSVMQEEIFGPILPVIAYEKLEDVISEIISRPKPLALYLFTEHKSIEDDVLSKISFGGGCINDTIFHLTHPQLPFGGVGESGIGRYHGKYSFETFTHQKSIVKQTTKFDIPIRYDSSRKALEIVRKFLK
jgi:aldehyde dehydrogenase (NAD+)